MERICAVRGIAISRLLGVYTYFYFVVDDGRDGVVLVADVSGFSVMSANVARSSAMDRCRARDAGTLTWSVSRRLIW